MSEVIHEKQVKKHQGEDKTMKRVNGEYITMLKNSIGSHEQLASSCNISGW